MVAPVVARLTSEIAASNNMLRRAELTAELGCYLARDGDRERVAKIVEELRASFGNGQHARISTLIMLIEALRYYFGDQDPRAYDRLRRACLISSMLQDRQLMALSEAWMAHLHFNAGRFVDFGASLARAFAKLDDDNLSAKCRLAISLADAYVLLGDIDRANFWYTESREAAVRYGDQAAIGAVTYNRAALQVYAFRTGLALGEPPKQDPQLLLTQVESAINYQRVAGLTSLDDLLYTAKISGLIVLGRFAEARDLAQQLLGSVETILTPAQQSLLAFEHALCLFELGDTLALTALFDSDSFVNACISMDAADRLIIFSALESRAVKSIGACGHVSVVDLLERARSEFEIEQRQLHDAVAFLSTT